MRRLLGLIGLIGLVGLTGTAHAKPTQSIEPIRPNATTDTPPPYAPDHIDTTVFGWLSLDIDGQVFFIDNEYFGNRISGYTLPGFVLRPRLVLWKNHELLWGKGFTLEGGFHWLNLWGARNYPSLLSTNPWPVNTYSINRLHLLPWLQMDLLFMMQL